MTLCGASLGSDAQREEPAVVRRRRGLPSPIPIPPLLGATPTMPVRPTCPSLSLGLILGSALAAQEPDARAADHHDIHQQLAAASRAASARFEGRIIWDTSTGQRWTFDADGDQVPMAGKERRFSGWFRDDMLALEVSGIAEQGDPPVEVLMAGRHTILQGGDEGWRLVRPTALPLNGYAPDPQLLLRMLSLLDCELLDHSISAQDGRAVEFVSLTLRSEQVDALTQAGALLDPHPAAASMRRMLERQPNVDFSLPAAIVDAAIEIDTRTRAVTGLTIRAIAPAVDTAALRRAMGGRGAVRPAEQAEEPAAAAEPRPADRPTRFTQGLPERDTADCAVRLLEFRLREHGAVPAPELDTTQRRLLGR